MLTHFTTPRDLHINYHATPFATVTADGDVFLDWPQIELIARDKTHPNWAYARVFLAIRNKDWKPLSTTV